MFRKAAGIYSLLVLLFAGMVCRIYALSMGESLAMSANTQSAYLLEIDRSRGMIYDCKLQPLVSTQRETLAAVQPSPEATQALAETEKEGKLQLGYDPQAIKPYLLTLPKETEIYSKGVEMFDVNRRYAKDQLAPHVIGYLTPDHKNGAAGIELGYDELLNQHAGTLSLRYTLDALGVTMSTRVPEVKQDNYADPGGVVLTLDTEMQQAAEQAMRGVEKGAAVVMEIETGNIKSLVSMPAYDPNNLARSLKDPDSPFVNRAFSQYNVGSTFKLIIAAAALEKGYGRYNPYVCKGYIDVNGHIFYCHWRTGHGELDMKRAIEVSCNPYFVQLGLIAGSKKIVSLAREIGFTRAAQFTEDLITQSGTLPPLDELENDTALANLSFGQGKLTATPIQIAQMISTVANGGLAVTPRLVEGFTDDGKTLYEHTTVYTPNQVFSQNTSDILREYLVANVEDGSGKLAKPVYGGAGGKTASAQTGIYKIPGDEDSEIVHAWFAGYYPAQSPRYAIVVLVEDGDSGGDVAAPIFKKIADGIYRSEL